jgi:predicted DNA-binding protein (UPF0278 family)
MALELQYWANVIKKIDERIAKTKVENIYKNYLEENREKVQEGVKIANEAKKKAAESKDQYQTPFTALKIDNTKRGMRPQDGQAVNFSNEDNI